MLQKDGNQLVKTCEERRSITQGQKYYKTVKNERNIPQRWQANWFGHSVCVNFFLKHVTEGRYKGGENGEEDVRSYWMSLNKPENTGN